MMKDFNINSKGSKTERIANKESKKCVNANKTCQLVVFEVKRI